MNKILILLCLVVLGSCQNKRTEDKKEPANNIVEVASIKGQQLTGVTVSEGKRLFVNFPCWRENVQYSVTEIDTEKHFLPYPNEQWNSWKLGESMNDSVFVAVQSVVASKEALYVIDTRNPLFQGVQGQPIIFVFDLKTNKLKRSYPFPSSVFHQDSYINDVRIDHKRNYAYFTDSGHAGLVLLNLENGEAKRVLDKHPSASSEMDGLTIDGKKWSNTVHADGIAIDTKNEMLYYHALTGYNLYAIPLDILVKAASEELEQAIKLVTKTAAPDGMIIDSKGNLYYADLEKHRIMKYQISEGKSSILAEGAQIKWADTFSIYENELYYTNSRIHETGADISQLDFTVNKIRLD